MAIPHDEVEGAGFTPPPAVPPRRRPGNGTWWRHGLAGRRADRVRLFAIVFDVSAARTRAGRLSSARVEFICQHQAGHDAAIS